jgi:hypothetical protein
MGPFPCCAIGSSSVGLASKLWRGSLRLSTGYLLHFAYNVSRRFPHAQATAPECGPNQLAATVNVGSAIPTSLVG